MARKCFSVAARRSSTKAFSDETANGRSTRRCGSIIDECYAGLPSSILEDNVDKLHMMADALMQYETIDSEQIDDIMAGRKPREPPDWGDDSGSGDAAGAARTDDYREQGARKPDWRTRRRALSPAGFAPASGEPPPRIGAVLHCAGSNARSFSAPDIMGVINVNPRLVFRWRHPVTAGRPDLDQVLDPRLNGMVAGGRAMLDVGGESTRPGAEPVSTQEEMDRVLPRGGSHRRGTGRCHLSGYQHAPEVMRRGRGARAQV